MPTTLPVRFSVLPLSSPGKTSIVSGISPDLVVLALWSMTMLTVSLFAIHAGLPIEAFNFAFQ